MKIKVKIKRYITIAEDKVFGINDTRIDTQKIVKYCNFDNLVKLTKSNLVDTRIHALDRIIRKYNYNKSTKVIRSMLSDPSVKVRQFLTRWDYSNRDAKDIIEKLFNDKDFRVRHSMLVAMEYFDEKGVLNQYLPKLIKDRSNLVRTRAKLIYNKVLE